MDLTLTEGQATNAPPVRLIPGCVVGGLTTVDGVPTGQVKVSVQLAQQRPGAGMFIAEAVSNSRGEYVLTKRVPPGTYEMRGWLVHS